jgi:alkaline phosphatase
MRKLATLILVVLVVAAAGTAHATAKNVIVMISDGWGQSQLDATAYWNGSRAVYETDSSWTVLGMTNYMYCEGGESAPYGGDGFVGLHGYDPEQAWADWYYQQNYATDSAAAATAMSCGEKTYQGSIGMGVGGGPDDRVPLFHVMERAEELGMATGLVTSVQLSHATPAAFRAHNVARGNYAEIAMEMIYDSGLDVIMGAGHPNYGSNGEPDPGIPGDPGDWKYVGGYDTWMDLAAGTAGAPTPWTLIDEKADFEALADGSLVLDRVFGCAQVASTLQHDRMSYPPFNDPEPPYTDPFIANVPSLATMTAGALNVLGQDPDGFVAMIEGGAVDWAGHARGLSRLIEEQDDFNAAVEAVIAWVEANSNWDETCLIVTGDHETGFLWGPGVDPENSETWFTQVQDNGAGNVPGFYFYSAPDDDWQSPTYSAGHTNQVIPFYVKGIGTERLLEFADEHDGNLPDYQQTNPLLADYVENTEVALTIFDILPASVAIEDDPEQPEEPELDGVPAAFALHGNYPNPFNPSTTIKYDLPRTTQVALRVYDLHGRLVRTLVDGVHSAGGHEVVWDGRSEAGRPMASGIYYCQLATDDRVAVTKMSLVK